MTQSETAVVVPLLGNKAVLFPSLVLRLSLERPDTISLLRNLASQGSAPVHVACVPLRQDAKGSAITTDSDLKDIASNLLTYGCLGKLLRIERADDGFVAVIEGLHRVQIKSQSVKGKSMSSIEANIISHGNTAIENGDVEAQRRLASLKSSSTELISTLKGLKLPTLLIRRLENFVSKSSASNAGQLCDLMASVVDSAYTDKIDVLSCIDISERLKLVHELVSKQLNTIKVSRKISSTVDQSLNKQQKEFILRQKMNAIKKELGQLTGDKDDAEADEDDAAEYRKKIDAAQLSTEAKTVAEKELKRLKRMQPQQAEYQVIRTYLDNILEVPWLQTSQNQELAASSIAEARRVLDEDHFGLEKVKKRLIEYLAILRLRQTLDRERDVKIESKL